jgi:hypothetical protein
MTICILTNWTVLPRFFIFTLMRIRIQLPTMIRIRNIAMNYAFLVNDTNMSILSPFQ